jgi:hypothetical protein
MCQMCTLLFPEANAKEIAGTAVRSVARIWAGQPGNRFSVPGKGRVPFVTPQGSEWL